MKVIELGDAAPTLNEVVGLAEQELVVLRQPDGSVFAITKVDDLDVEAQSLSGNPRFMALLKKLSADEETVSIEQLRKDLAI